MLGLDARAARWTWTAALVLLLLGAVYRIREPIFILIISVLFAYLLIPLVNIVNRALPGRSRAPALALTYLVLVTILVVLGIEIGTQIAEQATSLVSRAPQFLHDLQVKSDAPNLPYFQSLKVQVIGRIQSFVQSHSGDIVTYLPSAGMKVLSASGYLIFIVLVPIISFFLMKDARSIYSDLVSMIPEGAERNRWANILADTNILLGQYVRAMGVLCLTTFVTFALVFSIFGVPYGILLASIAFPLEFIPMVGPLVAAVIIITVTVASGYDHWLGMIVFLGIYRLFQDYVLSPRLMSSGVEVHPLLVILGVLAGEKLGGVAGMLLSVPVIAFLRVLYRRFVATRSTDRIQVTQ